MMDKNDKKEKSEEETFSPLRRRLIMGVQLLDKWEKNPTMSSTALAEEESMDRSLLWKVLNLVNLAPDIVEAIMDDPPTFDISVKKIFSQRLPDDWNEQRKLLGLPEKNYAG